MYVFGAKIQCIAKPEKIVLFEISCFTRPLFIIQNNKKKIIFFVVESFPAAEPLKMFPYKPNGQQTFEIKSHPKRY